MSGSGEVISTRKCTGGVGGAYMYSTTPLMFEGENLTQYNKLAAKVSVKLSGNVDGTFMER